MSAPGLAFYGLFYLLIRAPRDFPSRKLRMFQDDSRCSWEPPSSFTNATTIAQWETQLAAGDTLDQDEVAAVEARMAEHKRKEEEIREKKERKLLRKKRRVCWLSIRRRPR